MGLIIGLLFDAAIIGIVIAAMEKGEFPGWGPMLGCVLAMGITSSVAGAFLPDPLWFLAPLAGAAVGAYVISWLCHMSLKRAAIASGIYLGVRIVLGLMLYALITS